MGSLFIGSKKIGYSVLKTMYRVAPNTLDGVITIDDRRDTRSYYGVILKFCREHNLIVQTASNRRQSEELMFEMASDLCVVAGWYWIIGEMLIKTFRFVGIHHSLLPKYRGGAPLVWAMINGAQFVGTSLFSFANGMDDGNLWAQKKYQVKFSDYINDVSDHLEIFAIDMIKEWYLDILFKKTESKPQPLLGATYCGMRYPEDGLIDWNKPACVVYNFIRAQSRPYPGAFTLYNGKKVIIWRAEPLDYNYFGTPGQVLESNLICCGDMKPLRVIEIDSSIKLNSSKIRLGR